MLAKQGAQAAKRVSEANELALFTASVLAAANAIEAAAAGENPLNSYYWEYEFIADLLQHGFLDTDYMACAHGGARAKKQRLRHNVKELESIGSTCKHIHHKDEWKQYKVRGKWVYPTQEEAEFTADLAFAIAVALSHWACRVGRAKLAIPRCHIS